MIIVCKLFDNSGTHCQGPYFFVRVLTGNIREILVAKVTSSLLKKQFFFSISSHFGDQEGIVLGCDCALICMPILVHKSSAISFLLYSAFSGLWII